MNVYNFQNEDYTKVDPNHVDIEVGRKIKELRLIRGMSQGDLGKKVGITFQQIQKYEKGINRVLVSRLYDLARALSIDIPYFFSNVVPNTVAHNKSAALYEDKDTFEYNNDEDIVESKEILGLVREYKKIKSKKLRSAIYSLIKSLSQD